MVGERPAIPVQGHAHYRISAGATTEVTECLECDANHVMGVYTYIETTIWQVWL